MTEAILQTSDTNITDDLAVLNEALLHQAVTEMVRRQVEDGHLSIQNVVTGLCRIGTLSLVVSILTGMKEPGLIIAIVGILWLYRNL